MIDFLNVSKHYPTPYGTTVVLHDLTLRLQPTQSVGILMEKRSGKTTLINMLSGVEMPTYGKIIRSSRVSFPLGSSAGVNSAWSFSENCRFIARIHGADPDYLEAFCVWMVGSSANIKRPLGTVSGDVRRQFLIALSFALDFDFYLIDEGVPVTNNSAFNRRLNQIAREKKRQAALLVVSHDLSTLARFTDTVYKLTPKGVDLVNLASALVDAQSQNMMIAASETMARKLLTHRL